ncbi:MAG: diacylglycerol kinase family protein [Prolixibacteraceae bacterium]|nr:diacylglycerol kinase family protein [Prolixibacteraceae bacterium]
MNKEKFSFRKRWKSFGYAFNGLKLLFVEEHNSRIHLVAAVLAIALGWALKLSMTEWVAIFLVIGAVFAAELFNSAIENLAGHLAPQKHEKIKKVKDMAAAAVLVCAITAVAVACFIFLPKILAYQAKIG